MRDVFETGIFTELTQGSIINNCISEDFCDCEVWGCVITPRCDLANGGKVTTFHYLPIIDFEIWVDKVMRMMLLEEYYSGLKASINQMIEKVGGGKSIMDVFVGQDQIIRVAEAKMKGKELSKFLQFFNQYFNRDTEAEKDFLLDEKHYKTVLKNLKSNDIHGYYLIESWKEPGDFKIIVLRDIRRMSISTRSYYEEWRSRGQENEEFYRKNDVSDASKHHSFYRIESCIKSPFIENIMQSFSYSFTRIGIPSFESGINAKLVSTIKAVLS